MQKSDHQFQCDMSENAKKNFCFLLHTCALCTCMPTSAYLPRIPFHAAGTRQAKENYHPLWCHLTYELTALYFSVAKKPPDLRYIPPSPAVESQVRILFGVESEKAQPRKTIQKWK